MRTKNFILPGGFLDEAGKLHGLVEIAEMTGRVQAEIVAKKGNMAHATNALLTACLKKLGDIPKLGLMTWKTMLGGDRDFVMFHAMRPWRGGTEAEVVTGHVECQGCKARIILPDVEISSFKKYVLKDAALAFKDVETGSEECEIVVIEDVERGKNPDDPTDCIFKLKDDGYGVNAVFRLPIGIDQERIASAAQKNQADARHALYAFTCKEWDGKPGSYSKDFFADMPTSVLDWLWEQIKARTPGLEPDVQARCDSCNAVTEAHISDFLPTAARAKRSSTTRSSG